MKKTRGPGDTLGVPGPWFHVSDIFAILLDNNEICVTNIESRALWKIMLLSSQEHASRLGILSKFSIESTRGIHKLKPYSDKRIRTGVKVVIVFTSFLFYYFQE